MAEGKNKIIIYRDWINTFDALQDDEAGRLIKHLFRYVNDMNPEPPDRLTGLLFEPIKQTLKRDLKLYEAICLKNSDNVKLRWNKKDTTVYDRIRTDTKHTDIDTDSDTDIDKDKKKEKKNKYLDYVSLTEKEFKELSDKHGEKNAYIFINILNNYKGSTGKKYKNDYMTILNWVIDKAKKEGKYIQKPMMP